jgi:hypothetical protein
VIGGAKRDRTADLLVANEALSQLSYSPTRPTTKVILTGLDIVQAVLQAAEKRVQIELGNLPLRHAR